ncbi:asparagine synthase (glutamine-hydrolyzing) [Herminiimonas aquatilis]|uniref:asparagine synthase (glutamine-hydrolyzing) n=1 Tax=Herminiimonas aquatilis TaxID=345342 RepID=A0ABW2J9B1_9BURK
MCGIFGFLGGISREQASHCLDTLAHRGPDGSGLWHQPEITLGHRRLSILDLSDNGKQPMSYANGRYQITFNGEIYNFLEIRSELELLGHKFHSESDTEVVLAAFAQWGEQCLSRFNGMWAFALWDVQEQLLFLSRDRFGKKPLYYADLPRGKFAFSSEMKALFPLLGKVTPNVGLVGDTSRIFLYESTNECIVEGIKRLPPGHNGWLKNGKLRVERWWCTLDHLPEVPVKYADQVEQFRELFLDACRLRMRSDVSLGTALSGGLDSSATISCMSHIATHGKTARMGESWQHAFVASFPGTPLDELKYARLVTDHIGIDPVVIDVDPMKDLANLGNSLYLFEDLYITSPIPFMQTYRAVKSHSVSVTLDGHGADELFGGYSFDYIRALDDAGWNLSQAADILRTYYSSFGDSTQLNNRSSQKLFLAKWHGKKLLRKMLGRGQSIKSLDSGHPSWSALDKLNQQLYVSTHETILPTLLRNYDRYSMANGVEIRMPFMDHRIVSFAFAIPWTSKVRNGFSKAIVRDAVAPFMPKEIAYRKTKIGFNSPILDWMKGPLKNFMFDTISSQSFKDCQLIDSVKVASQIQYAINNSNARFSDGELAWTMLTPYLWERAVIKRESLT